MSVTCKTCKWWERIDSDDGWCYEPTRNQGDMDGELTWCKQHCSKYEPIKQKEE